MKSFMGISNSKKRQKERKIKGESPWDDIPTPYWVIDKMIQFIGLERFRHSNGILDPCTGDRRMINMLIDKLPNEFLRLTLYDIKMGSDFFLEPKPIEKYDIAILNPPFSNLGEYRFCKELLDNWINENGCVCSVMTIGCLIQGQKRFPFFNQHISKIAFLPTDTFKEYTGSLIHACVVLFEKDNYGHSLYEPVQFWQKPDGQGELL